MNFKMNFKIKYSKKVLGEDSFRNTCVCNSIYLISFEFFFKKT